MKQFSLPCWECDLAPVVSCFLARDWKEGNELPCSIGEPHPVIEIYQSHCKNTAKVRFRRITWQHKSRTYCRGGSTASLGVHESCRNKIQSQQQSFRLQPVLVHAESTTQYAYLQKYAQKSDPLGRPAQFFLRSASCFWIWGFWAYCSVRPGCLCTPILVSAHQKSDKIIFVQNKSWLACFPSRSGISIFCSKISLPCVNLSSVEFRFLTVSLTWHWIPSV